MTDATTAARQLQVALDAFGEVTEHEGDIVRIPSLAVEVRISEVDVRDGGAVVVYELCSLDATEPGLTVLAVGYGDTREKAVGEAAFQWVAGVFAVVRHWLVPSRHTCFVEDIHMLVRAQDPEEEFGWRVHLGAVLSRAYGEEADDAPMPAEPLDVIRVLFDDVHPHAAHRSLFWIEAFAVRHADGHVDATCRLHNDHWPEGRDALIEWALTWKTPPGTMVSARQFLLFEPMAPSEVSNRRMLRNVLNEADTRKSPWWKRLFAR